LRRTTWILGASVTAVVAAGGYLTTRPEASGAPAPRPDVPYVEDGVVHYSESFARRVGLALEPIGEAEVVPSIRVSGRVTYDPAHVAAVGSRLGGLVRRVHHYEGDVVSEGQVLAEIESGELASVQASLAVEQAHQRAAERNLARERELADKRLTTARELEAAEASLAERRALVAATYGQLSSLGGVSKQSGVLELTAPRGGTLVERHVVVGQTIEPDSTAFRIADLDHLWIELDVYERHAGVVRMGDRVELEGVLEGMPLEGRVSHVGETVHPRTRTIDVRVEVDNRERRLRPGQSVSGRIRTAGQRKTAPTVPLSAVTWVDGSPTIFVVEEEGRARVRPVRLGLDDGSRVELAEPLEPGVRIVSAGVFALKSELFR
jgi:cobalt-zinc-cadmium efflux system membrane fusion protein